MAKIASKIYSLLLLTKTPLTTEELQRQFEQNERHAVAVCLSKLFDQGVILRIGKPRGYSYFLAEDTRRRLQAAATNTLRQKPKQRTVAIERSQRVETRALQPIWPALQPVANLSPLIALPWIDEEELPPVMGERYVDAMHQIAMNCSEPGAT